MTHISYNRYTGDLKKRFKTLSAKYPDLSSFIVFGRAVSGRKMTIGDIGKGFDKLVDKNDYSPSDRDVLLNHFFKLSFDGMVYN